MRAISRMVSTDSCLASPMKPQVFTTMTSARAGSVTISCPWPMVSASMTSVSTRFFGQPSETKYTEGFFTAIRAKLSQVGRGCKLRSGRGLRGAAHGQPEHAQPDEPEHAAQGQAGGRAVAVHQPAEQRREQ